MITDDGDAEDVGGGGDYKDENNDHDGGGTDGDRDD